MVCDPYFRAVIKISRWQVNDTSQARNQTARDFVLFYLLFSYKSRWGSCS